MVRLKKTKQKQKQKQKQQQTQIVNINLSDVKPKATRKPKDGKPKGGGGGKPPAPKQPPTIFNTYHSPPPQPPPPQYITPYGSTVLNNQQMGNALNLLEYLKKVSTQATQTPQIADDINEIIEQKYESKPIETPISSSSSSEPQAELKHFPPNLSLYPDNLVKRPEPDYEEAEEEEPLLKSQPPGEINDDEILVLINTIRKREKGSRAPNIFLNLSPVQLERVMKLNQPLYKTEPALYEKIKTYVTRSRNAKK